MNSNIHSIFLKKAGEFFEMIRILDTFDQIKSCFIDGNFSIEKWVIYMDAIYQGSAKILIEDINQDEKNGLYSFQIDCLPIIQSVVIEHEKAEQVHLSFLEAIKHLEEWIHKFLKKDVDVDIVMYMGLCHGAGWYTNILGRKVILLGIEKIIELNWIDSNKMKSLIYHELGHAYHDTYGVLERTLTDDGDLLLWRLLIEGIAMVLEQELLQDDMHFHQFDSKEIELLEKNVVCIAKDFYQDMQTRKYTTQRWFGDWVKYNYLGDVGYFLGAKFVRFILEMHTLDEAMNFEIYEVHSKFLEFIRTHEDRSKKK